MKDSVYRNYDELPLFLNAKTVAKVLGVSPSSGYELMHQQNFPTLKIGNRIIVPKERFIQWVERNTSGDDDGSSDA
nr:helix-turn-helix domain-containing protein [uncultured Oscillibacter sp.]